MKVKIINKGMNTNDCKVFIDGCDVTRNLTEINVDIKAGKIPTLKLSFIPDEIEIEGDYEVIKEKRNNVIEFESKKGSERMNELLNLELAKRYALNSVEVRKLQEKAITLSEELIKTIEELKKYEGIGIFVVEPKNN